MPPSAKMEATKQNLLRLNDIIKEVKAQLNAISRQAKRAEQYKIIKQRIKETELTLALQNYAGLFEKGSSLQAQRNSLQDKDADMRAKLKPKNRPLEELKRSFWKTKNPLPKISNSSMNKKHYQHQRKKYRIRPSSNNRHL